MPLDLGHHPSWPVPTPRLIPEVVVPDDGLLGRPPYGSLQQVLDLALQHLPPVVGAMDVPRTEVGPLAVTELVEHKERVITDTAEVAIVDSSFLFAIYGLSELSMSRMMRRWVVRAIPFCTHRAFRRASPFCGPYRPLSTED